VIHQGNPKLRANQKFWRQALDTMPSLPGRAIVREVGLRDGLQSITRTLPTAQKMAWIRAAYAAGLREIEVGSFVPARLLPQLADTAELVAVAKALPGLHVSVLVPNLRGAEAAIASGAHGMVLPLSASHAHSLANLRKTPDEVVAEAARIRAARDAAGSKMILEGGVGTAFGCTLQGEVKESEVLRLMQALLDAGCDRVSLADTVGYADPAAVQRLFSKARAIAGDRLWCGHFHDTRGLGLANVYAALLTGVNRFDACLAGIGGCPHAPGASGNVATEDLAWMLRARGGVHPHGHGPHLRHGAGRPGRRGHQGRADRGRPHAQAAGRGRGLLPDVQPQQEEHRDRPAQCPKAPRSGAEADAPAPTWWRELQARHHAKATGWTTPRCPRWIRASSTSATRAFCPAPTTTARRWTRWCR
jgi:hydroxymethylglutaryl-CoA lyase